MATTSWAAAINKATVWGTPVAVGAGDGIKLESESLPEGIPEPINDDNLGDVLSGGTLQGNVGIEGTIVCPMRYEGPTSELLMAILMGQSNDGTGPGNTVPDEIDVGASYRHYMTFQANSDGLFATLMVDKDVGANNQYQYPGAKVSQVELAHNNGKLMGTFTLIAHSVTRDVTAPSGGDAQMAAVTHVTDALLAIFNQVELRLTKITGSEDNLTSSEEILVTDAKITINRNISGEFESGSNAGYVGEPDINGFPEAMLEFTVQDYKTGAVATLVEEAQTIQTGRVPDVYKAELYWTGINIPTTSTPYEMKFQLPALVIQSAPTAGGAPGSKVPVTVTMKVQTPQADSLPDGTDWSWASAGTDPFRFLLTNGRNVSILA
jgi:hypothetical protein